MIEELEIEGEWWLPESSSRRVNGSLVFGREEFALHTKNALREPPPPIPGHVYQGVSEPVELEVVWGTSEEWPSKDVTLLRVLGDRFVMPPDIKVRETWH